MGNPMVQVEHCPEIDDARNFEVEFETSWEEGQSPLIVYGVGLLEHMKNEYYVDGVLTEDIVMKMLNGDMEV